MMDNPTASNFSVQRVKTLADYKVEVKDLYTENFSLKMEIYNLQQKIVKIMGKDKADDMISKIGLQSENKQLKEDLLIKERTVEEVLLALKEMQDKYSASQKTNANLEMVIENLKNRLDGFNTPLQSETEEYADLEDISHINEFVPSQITQDSRNRVKDLEKEIHDKNHELKELAESLRVLKQENESLHQDLCKNTKVIYSLTCQIYEVEGNPLFKLVKSGIQAGEAKNIESMVSVVNELKTKFCELSSLSLNEVFPDLSQNYKKLHEYCKEKKQEIMNLRKLIGKENLKYQPPVPLQQKGSVTVRRKLFSFSQVSQNS